MAEVSGSFCGHYTCPQRDCDAIAYKRINEGRSVSSLKDTIAHRDGSTELERRGGTRRRKLPPVSAALCQCRMQLKHVSHVAFRAGPEHRANIDADCISRPNRLHAAIAIVAKEQFDSGIRTDIFGDEMRFAAYKRLLAGYNFRRRQA